MQTDVMHERLTKAFIAENPVDVVMLRTESVTDGAGGFLPDTLSHLPSQTVRYVTSDLRGDLAVRTSPDGRQVRPAARLVGMPGYDVAVGDQVVINDTTYQVVFVSRTPKWRITAEITEMV